MSSSPGLHHDAGQRPLGPLRVGDADDRRLGDLRVAHDLVLELDRADPLAAGLDDVLGAVDEADVAVRGRSTATSPVFSQPSSVNDSGERSSL